MNNNHKNKELDRITPLEEDFSKWYQDVIKQGNLISYGSSKGSMIFKPISFGIWKNINNEMDKIFYKNKIQNVYLPLLIPLSFIEKEKNHIDGFAPELAMVTKIGDKNLEEPFVVRPTSEVLFCKLFKEETRSYKNLPILYNQWVNVVRWEKTTNPFLRNREFLWQEGHTIHSSKQEAEKFAIKMINIYAKFLKDFLSIPVVIGEKTPKERFSGAVSTYTIEAMMKDGKALQSGTSHYLGQNFSKAFNIEFTNKENKKELVYQTSWGVSTRLIGALIMSHSDNRGIVIPPKIAHNQIDILSLFGDKHPKVKEVSNKLFKELSEVYRVRLDESDKGFGFKAGKSEIEGTPLRIEVGLRDLEKGNFVTLVRRDTLNKIEIPVSDVKNSIEKIFNDMHADLYISAKERLKKNIVKVKSYEELKKHIKDKKFVLAPFVGSEKEEDQIKKETGATTRCIPFDYKLDKEEECIITKEKTKRFVIFAKSY